MGLCYHGNTVDIWILLRVQESISEKDSWKLLFVECNDCRSFINVSTLKQVF